MIYAPDVQASVIMSQRVLEAPHCRGIKMDIPIYHDIPQQLENTDCKNIAFLNQASYWDILWHINYRIYTDDIFTNIIAFVSM